MIDQMFSVIDNSDKVIDAFDRQIRIGLKAIGQAAEKHAKEICPVKTGRLKNSLSNNIIGTSVYVGTNVKYAKRVEFDEKAYHKPPGQAHFLRDAATTHSDEYEKIMEATMKA